ncbi:cysteine hydrolase family protein [Anaeromicropila populeti]|uniref:Nicotinamidase-related amidase n=1 Tax=Anaeromicropila populeti TaxID=37658 RepID=A0A1I6KKN9_9FIRM|nr:isochorismatase family cysteine hydrolase [Anaeromicropila populeti]SFR91767.1 Nicotinamidase-related amidase [Anaeromicropila populeti]
MNTLLVVIDMQKDFIDGSLGTSQAVELVPKVIQKIKEHNGELVFTRDTHEKNYLNTQEGYYLPVEHCIKGTAGWQLEEEIGRLAQERNSVILDKPSFGSMELAEYLKKVVESKGVEEVQLIGLCTDICVISNAMILKAALPEVKVSVDGSCCAGVTVESHQKALEAMKMCQIQIIC